MLLPRRLLIRYSKVWTYLTQWIINLNAHNVNMFKKQKGKNDFMNRSELPTRAVSIIFSYICDMSEDSFEDSLYI